MGRPDLQVPRLSGFAAVLKIILLTGWGMPATAGFDSSPAKSAQAANSYPSIWTVECADCPVDANPGAGVFNSMSLDRLGNPHVSCFNDKSGGLWYAVRIGNHWAVQNIQMGSSIGQFTSLALDPWDYPHIAFWDAGYRDLKYATIPRNWSFFPLIYH